MTTRRDDDEPLIVLATFGTLGDLRPFLLIAAALRDRGHRVMLVAPRLHEVHLIDSGLPHRMYGTVDEAVSVLDDRDLWHHRRGFAVLLRSLLPCIEAVGALLAELATVERCVLLCHAVLLPAADIARKARPRLPVVGVWLAPANLRTCENPLTLGALSIPPRTPMFVRRWLWAFVDRYWVDPDILPGLNALRAGRGLPPVSRFFQHLQNACDASIGLFPPWFGPTKPGWPDPFIEGEFPLPPALEAPAMSPGIARFIADGSAPIVFTAGTGMRQANRFFAEAQRALQRMGRRGIFVTAHAAQLPGPSIPEVHREPFVDFARVLPAAAGIVHHGGIGTTAEALRAGVPQLITPFGFDQFDNAARVRALGVGDVLPAARVTAGRLRRALERLLSSRSVVANCRTVAAPFVSHHASTALVDRVDVAIRLARRRRD